MVREVPRIGKSESQHWFAGGGALWRDVWDGFRGSPGRIGIALAALAIGMIALTLLLAVLEGLRQRAEKLVGELGADCAAVLPARNGDNVLSPDLLPLVRANLPGAVAGGANRFAAASPDGRSTWTVVETDEFLAEARRWSLRGGRFLDAWDVSRARRSAVVTEALARRAGVSVGGAIRIQEIPFTVVGVVGGIESESSESGAAWSLGSESVFIPRTVALRDQADSWRSRPFDVVYVRFAGGENFAEQVRKMDRLIASTGRDAGGLSWVTPDVLLAGIRRMQQTVAWAAGSIAALCLLLGGTTLMSLMLANVRERVGEIGLRRSLGAQPADIAVLFVFEACLTTLAAAALGAVVALPMAGWLGGRVGEPLVLSWRVIAIPVLASIALGCIFSILPARRAALLNPADALRDE